MIEDYAEMLHKALDERQQDYVDKLIATDVSQERNRGIVHGLSLAIELLVDTLKLHNIEERRAA